MRALHATHLIAMRRNESGCFSGADVDMAQALNQFLTPKSYSILTTFSGSIKGCVFGCGPFSQPAMLVVYPVIHVKSQNAGVLCILLMRVGVWPGVSLCFFGPVDLRDETTIARIFVLICAVLCMISFASKHAPANDTFPGTTLMVSVITDSLTQGSSLALTTGPNLTSGDAAPLGDTTDIKANNWVWTTLSPSDEINFTGTYTVFQQDVDLLQ